MSDPTPKSAPGQEVAGAKSGSLQAKPQARKGSAVAVKLRIIAVLVLLGSVGLFVGWASKFSNDAQSNREILMDSVRALSDSAERQRIETAMKHYQSAQNLSGLVLILATVLAYGGVGLSLAGTVASRFTKKGDAEKGAAADAGEGGA